MLTLDLKSMLLIHLPLADKIVIISKLTGECCEYNIDNLLQIVEKINEKRLI